MSGYRALDWSFTVVADSPVVAGQLRRVLVDLRHDDEPEHRYALRSPGRDPGVLLLDGEELLRSPDEALLHATLLWHLNRGAEQATTGHVLLHAAAAALPDGRAAVLAAPSESGKTTLVAGLVRSGLHYVTDEMVALDPAGLGIASYPKPLSVDDGSWRVLADLRPDLPEGARHLARAQWQVPVTSLPGGTVAQGAVPALLVLPRYNPDAGRTTVEAVHPADALVALLHSTFAPERSPERDFRALARLCRAVPCVRLVSADLDDAVRAVTRELLAAAGASEQGD